MNKENHDREVLVETLKILKEGNLRLADVAREEGIKLTDVIHLEELLMDEFDISDERATALGQIVFKESDNVIDMSDEDFKEWYSKLI